MFIKGMTKADYQRMLGETNEDMEDALDGFEEAPESLYGNFEDDEEDD
jgi:hypothetical protein